ncbi:hypothetical protein ACFJIV_06735 [Mucilaginibacter sp. UC70_90]
MSRYFIIAKRILSATKYKNLRTKFHQYFSAINGKKYTIAYQEKGSNQANSLTYTKNELLDAIIGRMNSRQVSTVPAVMIDLIEGRHDKYVQEVFDGYFAVIQAYHWV